MRRQLERLPLPLLPAPVEIKGVRTEDDEQEHGQMQRQPLAGGGGGGGWRPRSSDGGSIRISGGRGGSCRLPATRKRAPTTSASAATPAAICAGIARRQVDFSTGSLAVSRNKSGVAKAHARQSPATGRIASPQETPAK